jgi:hypothetical protein
VGLKKRIELEVRAGRKDLNNPPTAVGGIEEED